jgi:Zn-finger nucleic acid-binding protein
MVRRGFAQASVSQCEGCGGLFLERTELGSLVEAETDWHAHRSSSTQPMPRITADMAEPPPARPRARSFIDALFKLGG